MPIPCSPGTASRPRGGRKRSTATTGPATAARTGVGAFTRTESPAPLARPSGSEGACDGQLHLRGDDPASPAAAAARVSPSLGALVRRPRRVARPARRPAGGAFARRVAVSPARLPRRSAGAPCRGRARHGRRAHRIAASGTGPAADPVAVLRTLLQPRQLLLL